MMNLEKCGMKQLSHTLRLYHNVRLLELRKTMKTLSFSDLQAKNQTQDPPISFWYETGMLATMLTTYFPKIHFSIDLPYVIAPRSSGTGAGTEIW